MMSAAFILFYYLDIILYENFSPFPSPSSTRSLIYIHKKRVPLSTDFHWPHFLSRSPSGSRTSTIVYYRYYTGVHVHTVYTISADASKKYFHGSRLSITLAFKMTSVVQWRWKRIKNCRKFAIELCFEILNKFIFNGCLNFRSLLYLS